MNRAPSDMAGAPLLSVENLTIPLPPGMDRAHAVERLSYEVKAGEIVCVVGESGSGKSMTANAVMGLLPAYLRPSSGRLILQGRDLLAMPEPERETQRGRTVAMIFQEPLSALNPLMRVGDQIAEVMEVHGERDAVRNAARVAELIAYVGLPDPAELVRAYPFRLSGGQRQRVMIAMALALEPALLIADEPTTALDVTTQAQILELIRRIQRAKGMGVMFITHDFGVVADIADRVVVMERGCAVEQGAAAAVLNHPAHPYTRRLVAAVPHGRANAAPAGAGRQPLLEVRNLMKTYRSGGGLFSRPRVVSAVDGIDLTLAAGETLGLVGESGSGKSTLGRCLLKLLSVDGGEILFRGRDVVPLSQAAFRPLRRHMQMIFQDPFASLNPRQTVGRILSDGPVANGSGRDDAMAKARDLLALVGLEPSAIDRYPHEFSGGQRQRIGIARALALEPDLLVADESVSALDVSVQAQVLDLLQELKAKLGLAMIFITHDLRVAAQICDRIAVMHRGSIVECGPAAQIFDAPVHPYTRRLIAAVPGRSWQPPRGPQALPQGATMAS
ncbi:ABC transporter ATP-binding protein [Phreatobacter sp. AB_2022a]|uniref:ABC transporter ATP-binding protein n=1 Tax=Phreatobacter sp. AB_2022a TaxID=3003134 RepID=UPI0022876D56|nr:ABC transporter ATP-binding protein [Phreatobacter sp. AB_2022a]MCZ0735625.1 ABC transporter ATP-binding protein [Phreatobacter sp. AB_2022a]